MEDGSKKTIIWETDSEPPKNYIWVKNGNTYVYNGTKWVISPDINISEVYEDSTKKEIVWESNSEIPDNKILVKSDGHFYENKAGVWFKSNSISKVIPSETLVENEATFAGFKLTSGPVYWTGREFSVKNNWNYNTYGTDFGKTTGSMYFKFEELVSYFNGTNTLDGYRLPTIEEWSAIVGTTRSGATVNEKSGSHNVYVTISDVVLTGATTFSGYLLFPDDATITGATLTRIDGSNDGYPTSLTSEQLNVYLGQGCVFLPIDGFYDSSQNIWNSGNTFYASSIASENNSNPLLIAPMGAIWTNQVVGKVYCFPARLVKEVPVQEVQDPHDYSQDYLTFAILENNGSFYGNNTDAYISTDNGETWIQCPQYPGITGLSAGDKILVKADNTSWDYSDYGGGTRGFYCDVDHNIEGNIMSIYDSENFRTITNFDEEKYNNYVFNSLFWGDDTLISAEHLILPVTVVPYYGYANMFNSCTSLTTGPEILATTLTEGYSCAGMFYGCTNLNYVKCLATSVGDNDTQAWLGEVSQNGTFVKASDMSDWATGEDGIPTGWTTENITIEEPLL